MTLTIVGGIVLAFGLAFLSLSLMSAVREVFPGKTYTEQLSRSPDTKSYTALLAEVGKLKTWLSLAVVGSILVFIGTFVTAPTETSRVLSRMGGPISGATQGR
jgi:hypothetical protein